MKVINSFAEKSKKFEDRVPLNIMEKKLSALEDKAHDCNAYLKVKHFLAKQVIDLESKLEEKDSFILVSTMKLNKYSKLNNLYQRRYELLYKKYKKIQTKYNLIKKFLKITENQNTVLHNNSDSETDEGMVDSKNKSKEGLIKGEKDTQVMIDLNFSSEIKSCYSFENSNYFQNKKIEENKEEILKIKDIISKDDLKKIYLDEKKSIEKLRCINEKYSKTIYRLNQEIFNLKHKNIIINAQLKITTTKKEKIENENILIMNELIELIQALRTLDLKVLNDIYLENLGKKSNEDFETLNLTSCLGIKYNILSSESFLSYLINAYSKDKVNEQTYGYLEKCIRTSDYRIYNSNYNYPKAKNFYYNKFINENQKTPQQSFIENANNINFHEKMRSKSFLNNEDFIINDNSPLNDENIEKILVNKANNSLSLINVHDSSLYNSLSELEDSDSFHSLHIDEFYGMNSKLKQSKCPVAIELSREEKKSNNPENMTITKNLLDLSKYEKELTRLLDKNLTKSRILTFSEID